MSEMQTITARPDVDIREDVIKIILTYPPLANDRHYIEVMVENGIVHLHGNTMTPINRVYLADHAAAVPGVQGVDMTRLFDDESIRLEIGRMLPSGAIANVKYGAVLLSGELPAGETLDELAGHIAALPGVMKVVAQV